MFGDIHPFLFVCFDCYPNIVQSFFFYSFYEGEFCVFFKVIVIWAEMFFCQYKFIITHRFDSVSVVV